MLTIQENNMWHDLTQWEEKNNAVVFMVITTEEVRDALQYYNAFCKDSGDGDYGYICDIDDVSERVVLGAIKYAYNTLNFDYGLTYEHITEVCYEYIVDVLQTTGLERGQIYNSETKQFESVKNFLARIGDKNAS